MTVENAARPTPSMPSPVEIAKPAGRIKSELLAQRVRSAMIFLLPMIVALLVVAGWPLFRTIYFSFTDASLTDLYGAKWVGFKNYLAWTTLKSAAPPRPL